MQRSQLDQRNAGYLSNLKPREQQQIGYRCLCCRDTALIPGDIIARYDVIPGHEYHCDYDPIDSDNVAVRAGKFYGAMGYLCRRRGCLANTVEVTALDDGRPFSKPVARFASVAVNQDITPETCEYLHQQEIARLKELAQVTPQQSIAAINQAMKDIPKPMPVEKPLDPAPEKPITELDGFKIGDRVRITVARFTPGEQKEIIRNKEVPVGAVGVIVGFEINRLLPRLTDAIVDVGENRLSLGPVWLESDSAEDVAA